MDQNLLVCVAEPAFLEQILSSAREAGFKVETRSELPFLDEFEAVFPDVLLLDLDLVADSENLFLEELSNRFPSIEIYLLADSRYSEEVLFSSLKTGARGWIFKTGAQDVVAELLFHLERKHFLKPFVAQLVLEEFRKIAEGELLLPIEEEILRQSARGVPLPEIEQNLNLSSKMLYSHWESIRQKLNINVRARKEIGEVSLTRGSALQEASAPKNLPLAHLVTFCLGHEEFAFNIADLQEIQRVMPMTPLPGMPSHVAGIANLRGTIVPMIDLRIRLGLKITPLTKEARVMLVNLEGKLVGIIVDSVKEVFRVQAGHSEAPPSLVLNRNLRSVKSVVSTQDRLILVLDLKELLVENEDEKVSPFRSAAG